MPHLDKVFFSNSGTEAVEAAIKFARAATRRSGIVYCSHAFHGLTYGSLSLNGDQNFRAGFGPLVPDCIEVAFNDLAALEQALASRTVAAFFVEPIQGKGVILPDDGYLQGAFELCRKYGTLFVADEIQTGLGRTGRFLASEHWGIEPDMVLLAKALSGGHVPVGAVLTHKWVFDKVFNSMVRAVVHGSTFSKNDLAMAAGLATLQVIESERLIERSAQLGERLLRSFEEMSRRHELIRSVRGKGLMIGVEFGPPRSARLRASWNLLETASSGLFCQLIVIPLFNDHKAAHAGCGTRQPYDQAVARADHLGRGLRLDRAVVRHRHRRCTSDDRCRMETWKDPRRQCCSSKIRRSTARLSSRCCDQAGALLQETQSAGRYRGRMSRFHLRRMPRRFPSQRPIGENRCAAFSFNSTPGYAGQAGGSSRARQRHGGHWAAMQKTIRPVLFGLNDLIRKL